MSDSNRDINILEHVLEYCEDIKKTIDYFGNSFEEFVGNHIYRNAVSMCILQIGELSGSLSDEFKDEYNDISWKSVKGMRNVMAHKYGHITASTVWETILEDIPDLQSYINRIMKQLKE